MPRAFVNIEMGQGVIAPFANDFATSQTLSCSGVAFVSPSRRMAGLFHYPAGAFLASEGAYVKRVARTMIAMSLNFDSGAAFDPEEIYFTPGGGNKGSGGGLSLGSSVEDISKINYFLKKYFGYAALTVLPPTPAPSISTADGVAILNTPLFNNLEFDVNDYVRNNPPTYIEEEVSRFQLIDEPDAWIFSTEVVE
jgi:hypothetical protein